MKITIIITAILFIYGAFATIFHDTKLAGNIGKIVGETNIYLFGYLAYASIFILFYPLYKLYTDSRVRKDIDFYLGWILLYIGLIIFQSMVVDLKDAGFIGTQIVVFLEPYIGKAGLWLLWLMSMTLALVFILDDEFSFSDLKPKFTKAPKTTKASKKSFSFSWVTSIFTFGKKVLKVLLTNPFASPSLEEEMMPILEKKETKARKTRIVKPRAPRKTLEKKSLVQDPLPASDKAPFDISEQIDDPVMNEILDLEHAYEDEVEKSFTTPKRTASKKHVTTTSNVEIVEELEENSKLMNDIEKGEVAKPKNFRLPKIDFLQKAPKTKKKINEAEIDRKIEELLAKLQQFKVDGDVIRTYSGPLVTTFEFKPAPNVKVSKILNLQDDLAMALAAETIRIQAPIPGRNVVGIEIPNESVETIYLREILESDVFKESSSPLTVALGKDIVGKPFVTDIKKLPHLLIAGTTGSGKSVGINAMILSLLYRNDPDQLKLMLIDPKMLEFSMYNDIPHLITPVITEPGKAIAALANMVGEMERRYKLMAESRTKNIENYNHKLKQEGNSEPLPYIVVVIDELADLMMSGGKEVELSIARLAQKSRACGIHLIVATQRPSVDVVTGLIKANLPSRLSYRVGQRIDSKVILDSMGAESLLGRGDGLFTPPGTTGLVRIHAPWATEHEIDEVVDFLKAQREPEYDESYLVVGGAAGSSNGGDAEVVLDPLYEEAKQVVLTDNKTSISYLQRKLQIGYNRSANIIEQLEAKGVLSQPNAKGNREIL